MSTDNTQDIENQQTFGQITAPPQFITDFYRGGLPGVPGLVPMANQFFLNQLYSMAEGQTPFDYGSRIADFTPAERKAFDMTYDRMGSYKPFLGAAGDIFGQSYSDLLRTGSMGEGLIGAGANRLGQFTDLATGMYGKAPGAAEAGTIAGAGAIGQGITGSRAGLGRFDPRSASSFFNPFETNVVDTALQDLQRQGDRASKQRRARAVSSGAFGGSRARLGLEEGERALRSAQGDVAGKLRQSGFDRAMQQAIGTDEAARRRALQQAGLMGSFGNQLAGMGRGLAGVYGNVASGLGGLGANFGQLMSGMGTDLAGIGQRGAQIGTGIGGAFSGLGQNLYGLQGQDIASMMNMGRTQRAMDQARMDEAYRDYVGKFNMPTNLLSQYAGIMGGITPNLGTYTRGYADPGEADDGGFISRLGDLANLYGTFQGFQGNNQSA